MFLERTVVMRLVVPVTQTVPKWRLLRVLVQTGKRIGDNGICRIAKLNGILYFAGRWFEDDIIFLCLRWYFRFKLSYRDLVAISGERSLSISRTTILR